MAIEERDGVAGKVCAGCKVWRLVSEFSPARAKSGDGYRARCRPCANEQARAERAAKLEHYRQTARDYLASRREESNEYQREWRNKNREKVRASGRAYKTANREKILADMRERRIADLEKYRARGRWHYHNNREKRRIYSRAYLKAHRDKAAAWFNARRARKKAAEGSHTEAEWLALKEQYSHTCLRCGKRSPETTLTRDHVVPLTKGGSDWITNIQPLCAVCNSSKGNKATDYRLNWQPSLTPEDQ